MSVLGAKVAQEIGEAYDGGKGNLDYVSHKIAHAALGGAMDVALGGDGVSGAIGGAVGEITGEMFMGEIKEALLTGQINPKKLKNWTDAGVDLSKLAAGFAAAAAGGDVGVAAGTGENAAANNAVLVCRSLAALERTAPAIFAAVTALYIAGKMEVEELNEMLREGAAALKAWVKEKYQSLSGEEKRQLDIPGFDATDIALEGVPGDTVVDNEGISTPDNTGIVDSGTVSEDQGGLVDDSGVIHSITHKNPLTAKKGDVIVTPDIDRNAFVRTTDGAWKHRKTGAIFKKSHTSHTDKSGEWKVGLRKGEIPTSSKKITVGSDGKIIKIDK